MCNKTTHNHSILGSLCGFVKCINELQAIKNHLQHLNLKYATITKFGKC